jgi:hypothetical protein
LEFWEWFRALTDLEKPVDFIEIPYADHLVQKPWDRRASMQGIVDWFLFWLKNERDSDATKAEQYARWTELRKLQEESQNRGLKQ